MTGRDTESVDIEPKLERVEREGVGLLVDEGAHAAGVLVGFAGRNGGISKPPYDTLNLAFRGGDNRDDVAENRRRAAKAAEFDPDRLALARQVHGADVIEVGEGDSGVLGEADVLVTRVSGPVLGILTADCTPVVLAGDNGVAIAHAGWRGLVAGAVERAVELIAPVHAAWVGPAIKSCCYEVGPEVEDAFRARDLPIARPGYVDPGEGVVTILQREGIERVAESGVCTHCDPSYFSYRRDGVTGRQGAFVALVEPRA